MKGDVDVIGEAGHAPIRLLYLSLTGASAVTGGCRSQGFAVLRIADFEISESPAPPPNSSHRCSTKCAPPTETALPRSQ